MTVKFEKDVNDDFIEQILTYDKQTLKTFKFTLLKQVLWVAYAYQI